MKILIVFLALIINAYADLYDIFYGTPIEGNETKCIEPDSDESFCIMNVKPCDSNEPRRIDGTCNNLDSPVRGSSHTPFIRLLPAEFGEDFGPRKTISGNEFGLPRALRTGLLPDGQKSDKNLTVLATHFLLSMATDFASQQDTSNYLYERNCCSDEGLLDEECVPHMVPDDDPVLNVTDIRCLNMTRPKTFQKKGCLAEGTTPERIISATPWFDFSQLYGLDDESLNATKRESYGGLLKEEVVDGNIFPPSNSTTTNSTTSSCPVGNTNAPSSKNVVSVWFWRQHNMNARKLAELNPCWDNDKLFYTARDINIAMYIQIYLYELLPILMTKERLINDELLSSSNGFRNIYNSSITPQISVEYSFIGRWFHTMLGGTVEMYDTDGYVNATNISNIIFNYDFIKDGNNMEFLTQGALVQASAAVDEVVDPYIAETALGNRQRWFDLPTQDLAKGRYLGIPSYTKNKEYFNGTNITCWDDLKDISPEGIEALKLHYETFEDVELIAGAWLEVPEEGCTIPPMVYAITAEQLGRTMRSDRHWYENEDRPFAFTSDQLLEVRNTSIARILCDVEDSVTEIQPSAFLKACSDNEIVECSALPQFDYEKWKDATCESA